MTVEAVPKTDEAGRPYDAQTIKFMHTTMQTLGRVAVVGGGIGVSLVNILMFSGVEAMVGAAGVVTTGFNPHDEGFAGDVWAFGESWQAHSDRPLKEGDHVRIDSVHGLVLDVSEEN